VNVLMVSTMVPSASAASAGAIVMHGEVEAIAARHRVTLATLATADDQAALRALEAMGIRVHSTLRHRDAGIGGLIRRAAVGVRWRLGDVPLRTTVFRERAIQRTLDQLRASRFDVVHVLDNAMANYRLPTARAAVLTEYEVRAGADDGLLDGSTMPPLRVREAERARWWRYQADVWARFDRVQVFTDEDAASVRRIAPHVGDRVRVNPFGVRVPAMTEAVLDTPDSVVFVGGFRHPPNVDAALWLVDEILPIVRARHPAARLTIVGADPPPAVWARASEAVNVTGRVDRVEPFVQSATVVVAPVRTGGGMRLKVLQAMALGRPVVTTPRGAAGIWNPPGAPTIRIADDAAGLAAHVIALLASPTERQALGARARAAVDAHHRWDQFAERLRALYDELPCSGAAA
jgi:glycosyltransferase involved in cell wall biosynthesis